MSDLVRPIRRMPHRPGLAPFVVGLMHGFLNGAESAASGIGLVGFVGSLAALAVVATLTSAAAVSLAQGWTRIAVRVAGSWIAAIGILMLGWLFRPGA